MEQPTPEELRQTIGIVQDHHKRLHDVEKFIDKSPSPKDLHNAVNEAESIRGIREKLIGSVIMSFGKVLTLIIGLGIMALIYGAGVFK